jgi:ABC-2 type transport system permease protein
MQFRIEFCFRILMDTVFYAVNLVGLRLIFEHTKVLAGWDFSQACLFLAMFLVIDGIFMTVFSANMWLLPIAINKGELDYYLLRPASSLFFLGLREFSTSSLINLACAIAILAWAIGQQPQPLTTVQLGFMILAILNGALLYTASNFAFILPVFWTHSGRGLANLYFSVTRFIERPDRLYHRLLRLLLRTLLPLGLIASVPAELILDGFSWSLLLWWVVGSVGYYAAVLGCWRYALRFYSSASS